MLRDLPPRYPLLIPCLGWVGGIFCAGHWEDWTWKFPALGLFACGLGLLFAKQERRVWWLMGVVCAFAWLRVQPLLQLKPFPSQRLAEWTQTKAWVDAEWQVEDYAHCVGPSCRFSARLRGYFDKTEFRSLDLGIQIKTRNTELSVIPGEVYRSRLRFAEPRGFHNPESFDYPRYLRHQGIFATAQADLPAAWQRERAVGFFYRKLAEERWALCGILARLPPNPERGVLAALLLGEETWLRAETEEDFRRCGLTHVLVVSGLHFTLLALCFYFPTYVLLSLRGSWADSGAARRWAFAGALPMVFAYGFLVGLGPSVVRGMGACALIGLGLMGRWRIDFGSSLILTAFCLLLVQPLWLFSLSFQLSFLSVAALWILGRAWTAWCRWRGPLGWGLTTLYSACAVNLALFPLLAQSFHEVSLVSPIANLVFVPYFSFLLPAELFAGSLSLLNPDLGLVCFGGLAKLSGLVLVALHVLGDGNWTTAWVGPWNGWDSVAYACGLATLLSLGRWRRCAGFVAGACLALFLSCLIDRGSATKGLMSLTVLDVGQGDSLLLQTPEGMGFVIDGGGFSFGDFDIGRNVVLPELLARSLRHPAALILSHPDADHWKGLKYLAERMDFREFWVGSGTLEHRDFATLRSILERRGKPIRILRQGEVWQQGGVEFAVAWPPGDAKVAGLSDNDHSLVLKVCYRQVCFWLTGDVEARGERGIEASNSKAQVAVLKVAHHGSATSSTPEFLRALQPRYALISVGAGNRYRLPNEITLRRLQASGALVYRTDISGQLEVETDGEKVWFKDWADWADGRSPSCWSAIRGVLSGLGS